MAEIDDNEVGYDDPKDEDFVLSDEDDDDRLTSSFIVTRSTDHILQDLRRQEYDEGCAKYEDDLRLASNGPKKRAIVQKGPPAIIDPINYPDFSGYACFKTITFDPATFYPLKTALLLLLNAHLLQDWYFEPDYVNKFLIALHGVSFAPNQIINRMIELRTTGYSKTLTIDEYIRKINNSCTSKTIRLKKYDHIPDALIFGLHVLSISGPIMERMGLMRTRNEIDEYITLIVNHKAPSRNRVAIHYDDDDDEEEEQEEEEDHEDYTFLEETVNKINATESYWEILGIPEGSDSVTLTQVYSHLSDVVQKAIENNIDGAQNAYYAINEARCKCEPYEEEDEEEGQEEEKEEEAKQEDSNNKKRKVIEVINLLSDSEDDDPSPPYKK
jgi:hypothetical protein